jgi:hypothetical protein
VGAKAAAQAATTAAAVTQPSAAAFAASFAAVFALAEPTVQEAAHARGSQGDVGMHAKERRFTQPEAPQAAAATGGSRMVTFDLPSAAQPPAQPSADTVGVSASAGEAAGGSVSSSKAKQSSSSSSSSEDSSSSSSS